MELSIPPVLLYAASWITITGGVWFLFERAETVASDEVKAAISRWLRNLDPAAALTNWPATFAAVFDRVFGERHLSWRCFSRSCIGSLVSVIIVTFFWTAIRPSDFNQMVILPLRYDPSKISILFLFLFAFGTMVNFIPDYLSLLETRYIIRWMRRRHSMLRAFAFLTLDLTVTVTIGLAAFLGFFVLVRYMAMGDVPTGYTLGLLEEFRGRVISFSLRGDYGEEAFLFTFAGICFYSTFFTSVWVWLYALSGAAVKLTEYLGTGLSRLRAILDIDNKPLRSLGFVSMLLVTVAYLIMPFVR